MTAKRITQTMTVRVSFIDSETHTDHLSSVIESIQEGN